MAIWSDNPDVHILVHLMVQDMEPSGTLEEIYQGIELDSKVKKTIPTAQEATVETPVPKKETTSLEKTPLPIEKEVKKPAASQKPSVPLPVEKEVKKPAASQKPSVPLPVEKEVKKPAASQKPSVPLPVEKEVKKPAASQKPSVPLPVEKEVKKPVASQKPSVPLPVEKEVKKPVASQKPSVHLPVDEELSPSSSVAEISEEEKPLRLPVDKGEAHVHPPTFPVKDYRKTLILVDLAVKDGIIETRRERSVKCSLEDYCHFLIDIRLRRKGKLTPLEKFLTEDERALLPEVGFEVGDLEKRSNDPLAVISIRGKEKKIYAFIEIIEEVLKEGYQILSELQKENLYTSEKKREIIRTLMKDDIGTRELRRELIEDLAIMIFTGIVPLPQGVDILLEKVYDTDSKIQMRAAEILGYIGSRETGTKLEEAIADFKETGKSKEVIDCIDIAMERIGKAFEKE